MSEGANMKATSLSDLIPESLSMRALRELESPALRAAQPVFATSIERVLKSQFALPRAATAFLEDIERQSQRARAVAESLQFATRIPESVNALMKQFAVREDFIAAITRSTQFSVTLDAVSSLLNEHSRV